MGLLDQAGPLLETLETQHYGGDFSEAEATLSQVQYLLGRAKEMLQSISNMKRKAVTL